MYSWSLCWAALLGVSGEGSYVLVPVAGPDGTPAARAEPYEPQEGNLVLFNEHSETWRKLYKYVGSNLPDHSGIMVKLPDGRIALLESAPDDGRLCGLHVVLLEARSRLCQYPGTMYIRRLRQPLSPCQSAALTEFALSQAGKRYAVGRLLLQATPIRCRSGWREQLFAHTYMNRKAWLCSELVVGAGTAAGLFDPHIHYANRIYPRDLLDESTYPDLAERWLPAAVWSPVAADRLPDNDDLARLLAGQ
jgi:hypothetical protein